MTGPAMAAGPEPSNGGASSSETALFRGVDRALVLAALAAKLRGAGLPATLTATERAAAALGTIDDQGSAVTLESLYWSARLSFVADRSQIAVFDAVFAAVFDSGLGWLATNRHRNSDVPPPPPPGDRHKRLRNRPDAPAAPGAGLPWATKPSVAAEDENDADDDGPELPQLVASAVAGAPDRPFDDLDEVELAEVCRLVEQWAAVRPTRPGRRRRAATTGRLELRAILRRAGRSGGDPVDLPRSRPHRRDRPVALLLDVSGSMESYARVYLHLARALVSSGPTEVFALSTDTVRLTAALRARSVDEAMDRATSLTGDRFGGTRLATAVGTIIAHRTWSNAVRGAVVVILSDGWDTDPPELLARRMARLGRLGHRVVWVNPRSAGSGYEPLVGGMAAALPYCDHFLSGHSLATLAEVLDTVADGR